MLAWFGTVELVLDKRHKLVVNTGLATCLMMIEERRKIPSSELAECMGGLDATIFAKLLQPLLDSTVVTLEAGEYSISEPSQIEPAKLT